MARGSLPLLWHFPISHFNEKVRWALDYKGIPHRRRALGASYMVRTFIATRQMKLPILFLDGKAISDSTHILEALERFKPDPPLIPRRARERSRAMELENYLDETLGDAVRSVIIGPSFDEAPLDTIRVLSTGMAPVNARVMKAAFPVFRGYYKFRHRINDRTVAKGHEHIKHGLDRLRGEIQPSGYLVGDQFSVADLTAASLLSALVGPTELEYAPQDPLPPSFMRIRQELGGDPVFRWVRDIYRRHRGHSAEVKA